VGANALTAAALALRFALELGALAALAYWGAHTGDGIVRVLLAVAAPLAAAALWGIFVAPKSARRLRDPARLAVELIVFGGAAAALVAAGRTTLGVAFAVVAVVDCALVRLAGAADR